MLDKKILFASADEHGCGWYRTKLIADYLEEAHVWFFPAHKNEEGNFILQDQRLFDADIIVIQRHAHEFFLEAIPQLQSLGKKVVYDIDDNLWNISASNPSHTYFPPKELKKMKTIIGLCDYMTVSTEPLKEYFLKNSFHTKITVIPNMLPDVLEYREKNNEKVRIGYAGSPTHRGDFSHYLCNALRDIKRKRDVELIFFGFNPIKGAECEFHTGVPVAEYLTTLDNLNLDIAIAPLADTLFNQGKSNLKYIEYSAIGLPTIASKVYPYDETIAHDRTGIIVSNEKHWYKAIEELVIDDKVRTSIGQNAREWVQKNLTYKYNGQLIKDRWEALIKDMYDIH
jgi:glycosyltransferase involved in cell wall biosynthesis